MEYALKELIAELEEKIYSVEPYTKEEAFYKGMLSSYKKALEMAYVENGGNPERTVFLTERELFIVEGESNERKV